ncbi:hypothetical protein KQX54_018486 [Cotesia glomerata]|uniref:Uncharacterized protein n=1 Tax=Cotesia glomerata TaxID=32391 RepID=A0AAV7IR39_COTGL|nr:hypothetical protein KQX54_018486 [Cotesia glomerata]
MATLYSILLAWFLLATVTSAEPVNHNDLLLAANGECEYLNNSSNVTRQNQYYRSLSPDEKKIVTHYDVSEYLACFIKKLNLFTLQDYKVYMDVVLHCLEMNGSNLTVTDPVHRSNVCILKDLNTIKSDNSIDADLLKKYLAIFITVTDELFDINEALKYFNNCVNESEYSRAAALKTQSQNSCNALTETEIP